MNHQFFSLSPSFFTDLTAFIGSQGLFFFFFCLCSLPEPLHLPEPLLMNQIALRLKLRGKQPHPLLVVDGVAAWLLASRQWLKWMFIFESTHPLSEKMD